MNEDWEQVTPYLQDMQHCGEEDFFSPHEVHSLRWKNIQLLFVYHEYVKNSYNKV